MNITFNMNNIKTPEEAEALRRSQNLMKEIENRAGALMGKDNLKGFDTNPEDGYMEFRDPDLGAGTLIFKPGTRELKEMDTFDGYTHVRFEKTADSPQEEKLVYEMAETDENADPDQTVAEKVTFNRATGTITYLSNF